MRRVPTLCTIGLKKHGVKLETNLQTTSKHESESKKVGLLIWKWSPKVLYRSVFLGLRPRVMALELLKNLVIFWIHALISFSKSPPRPRYLQRNWLFNSLSSSNIEIWEKEEIREIVILHDAVLTTIFLC